MENISKVPCLIGDTIAFRDEGFIWFFSQTLRKVAKIRSFDEQSRKTLKDIGFFGSIPKDSTQKHGNLNLMLLLGTKCPLRCLYCYAESGSRKAVFMSKEIAGNAVSSYFDLKPENPRVTLFASGEPTLNLSVIKYLLERYKNNARWLLTTSGIIGQKTLRFLIENEVKVTFSVDGPPDIQNRLRPMENGRPSSEYVESSLRLWKEFGQMSLTVRTTITRSTVHQLPEILEYFTNFGVDQVHLEPLSLVGRGSLCENEALDAQTWSDAVIYALDWAKKNQKTILIGELAHLFGSKASAYCGPINGTSLVVNHNGFLTACSEVADEQNEEWSLFCVGKLNNGFQVNERKLDAIKRRKESIFDCSHCFARFICKGGCVHKMLVQTENISNPMNTHCEFMRMILPRLIKRMVV